MSEKKTFSGLTLGKYTIQGLIGRGRKTEVYRTFHPDLKRDAALKIFFPNAPKTPELAANFRREAQAVADLKHPNIVQVYDFDIKDDHYYMVMELIEGTSLRDLISAHPTGLDRDNTVRIFSQIASAVAYAHDQKTVHGNLKPDNVLLDASQRPVLTDFALPCMMEHGQALPDTAGSSISTYLSPEQISQGTVDAQSDIYALGILLYEMATGDVPFKGDTRARIADQHLKAAPTPPSQIRVGLDPRTEQVILKALNKNPQDRPLSARGMIADLEREEIITQYETLAFDRAMAQEVRKRQSEVIRFRLSRTDEPIEEIKHVALSSTRWPLIAAGLACLILFLAVLAILLL